ncbi:BTAD domain-containing putative transcriptional regulator [Streptomyces sp. NPDC002680]|uniref:AfsR/SARP family transcriptional regulator n=1 Tax=Streptomyces sp. NPDC002680 TaxID=3364659 RepID=UPI0036B3108F
MREQVRFAVLGPVRAWRGTVEVDLGPPQQRAVLLLAEGSQVRVGELVDAVWGTEPVASATGSIRTYVHRLRHRLDPSVIRSMGDGYVVRVSPEELDVAAFRDLVAQAEQSRRAGDAKDTARLLRDALGLWRGTAPAGIRGEYAQVQRERLGALRLSALEARQAAELDLGAHTDVATEPGQLGDTHLSAGRPELARVEWTAAPHILERLDHADCLRAKLRELPVPDGRRVSPFA